MTTAKANVKELVGKDLQGFKIVEMTEVYEVNEDGRKSNPLGFFEEEDTAVVFVQVQMNKDWLRTKQTLVLTDGAVGYVVEDQRPVKFFDDEAEVLEIKKKVIAKLSPAERKILGFGD